MKILFVSAVLPYPLHSGGQIRIYNLLKRLSVKHEIHLFSFIRSESERQYLPELHFCKTVTTVMRGRAWQPKYLYKTIMSSYPLLWSSYHNVEMLSLLSDEVAKGKYDLIHIEPGYVWPSIPETHVPVVVCEHNIEHTVYEGYVQQFPVSPLRPFLSLDVAKMRKWEERVWKEAARIVTVSESDRAIINQPNVSVVPNGVDIQAFAFHPKKVWDIKHLTFLYVGDFRWMENKDAADYLVKNWWPAIQKVYPGSQLRIVGKHAPEAHYFVGEVDRIQDELNAADALLAPIRIGGGTKYKILEAMASGLPVITTQQGVEGMNVGGSVCVAKNSNDVLQSLELFADNKKRVSMIGNARKIIEKQYSWDMIAQKLDRIWNSR
jgi:glycosyltransferase involved in cell wall biosynthesis